MILGVGIDIVHNNRIKKSMERFGDRFLNKVFTRGERAYCDARLASLTHYAARFAAKEACIKACGGRLSRSAQVFSNFEVIVDAQGCPTIRMHGAAGSELDPDLLLHLSLTHDAMVSAAVAVLEKP